LTKSFDIVIVGGGIIGLLTALTLLSSTSLTVALIDEEDNQYSPKGIDTAYSSRVSAMTLQSKQLLSTLGVWPLLQKRRISPFSGMHIWNADDQHTLQLLAPTVSQRYLGYILENDVLVDALREALKDRPRFSWYQGERLTTIQHATNGVSLQGEKGSLWFARLLIGADGKQSLVRQLANIDVLVNDYNMHAIVATVKTEKPHALLAYQVFLPNGPLAHLPLSDPHYSSIVWSLPKDLADANMALSEVEFNLALTDVFAHCLGQVSLADKRYAFPLIKQQAVSYIAKRTLLLGDAAHVVHPLAGQGLNLGIGDILVLQEIMQLAERTKRDIASPLMLRRYERGVKAKAYGMLKAIDFTYYLFVTKHERLALLRSYGMRYLESLGFVKQQIMKFATGC
jgi:2-octaprenylphenol hydroxylase